MVGFYELMMVAAMVVTRYGVFKVLSTSKDTHLGGDDFDKRIID
ncbi:putative Heat shock protein 70 family [Helianthus debilis subsp. tardiflorus]